MSIQFQEYVTFFITESKKKSELISQLLPAISETILPPVS